MINKEDKGYNGLDEDKVDEVDDEGFLDAAGWIVYGKL
jgi:hypothetical protein